jgi:hypothetical protein
MIAQPMTIRDRASDGGIYAARVFSHAWPAEQKFRGV